MYIFMDHQKNSVGCSVRLEGIDHALYTVKSCTKSWLLSFTLETTLQRPAPNTFVLPGYVFIWHYTTNFEAGFTFINIREYCWRSNAYEVAFSSWTKQTLLPLSSLFTRHGRMKGWKDQRAEKQQYLRIIDSVSNSSRPKYRSS